MTRNKTRLAPAPRRPVGIDPTRLVRVPEYELHRFGGVGICKIAYRDIDNGVVVQIDNDLPGCVGTPWHGALRVAIKHTSAKSRQEFERRRYSKPITWDDMQAIKDHFWPDRIALEVFPPKSKIVNVADMRWMWVLPLGASLPFNLQGNSLDRLQS